MAVFGLNTQLVMLQGFTSDPEVLKAAVQAYGDEAIGAAADGAGRGRGQ